MKFPLFLLVYFFVFQLSAQPAWNWVATAGGVGFDKAYDIATDSAGNSYVTGFFADTAQFGSHTLIETHGGSFFLAKYSTGGYCLWVHKFDSAMGSSIALDASNDIYVLGQQGSRSFLMKWTDSGTMLWMQSLPLQATGYQLIPDAQGNFRIIGTLHTGTVIFGADTFSAPGHFIATYDPSGNALGAMRIGYSNDQTWPDGIEDVLARFDAAGNLYIGACISGTDSIGSSVFNSNSNAANLLLVKLDPAGNLLWSRQSNVISFLAYCIPTGLCLDPQGNCYVTAKAANGDVVMGTDTISGTSSLTSFIVKFDVNGNQQWLLEPSTNPGGYICFNSVIWDTAAIYFTGYAYNNFTLGSVAVTSNSSVRTYIIAVDAAGATQFAVYSSGVNGYAIPAGISKDGNGGVYLAGFTKDPTHFEPHATTFLGGEDIFVTKIQTGPAAIDEPAGEVAVRLLPGYEAQTFSLLIEDQAQLGNGARFVLYDMTGRIVKTVSLSDAQTQIDCRDLAKGIYSWAVENASVRMASGRLVN